MDPHGQLEGLDSNIQNASYMEKPRTVFEHGRGFVVRERIRTSSYNLHL